MKHKVLGSVFVLAIALGMVSVAVRPPQTTPAAAPIVKSATSIPSTQPAAKAESSEAIARPLASYKVYEKGIVGGMDYDGSGYKARVSEQEVRFSSKDGSVQFGAPIIEQGATRKEFAGGEFRRPAFGVAQLERGGMTEEYVFENHRMEQSFRFPAPLGEGALVVRIPTTSDFSGVIETRPAHSGDFEELQFKNGGVAFRDAAGVTKAAYHSAIAVDARDRRLALAPRYENGQIVLEVPASFMAMAAYPVVVDPWLEFSGSGTGGGITNTQAASDRPSIALSSSGNPFFAWSDNQSGNYEIYVKYWNGFEFKDLGGASFGGGLSNNPGKSTNPQVVLAKTLISGQIVNSGVPYVVWQDDTDGRVGIFFKRWDGESLAWVELDKSASFGGLSTTFIGPAINPQVAVVTSFVNLATLPEFRAVPILCWEEAGEIQVYWHYDGDDRALPGPAGWYNLGPVSGIGRTGGVASNPSIATDSLGRPVIAWSDTQSGSYEINLRRYQDATVPGNPFYLTGVAAFGTQIRDQTLAVFHPVSNPGVNGSELPVGISNTPTQLSQNPSVACDGTNITVAWEETLPAGPTGLNSEIYLSRNSGLGWAGLNNSDTGGGLSQSTGNSVHPSVDAALGTVVVAWSDDTSGNPEIYLRRFTVGTSTTWEQIGVQGSAFPLVAPDTVAPPDGVSKTASLSMMPQVRVDNFGDPTVIWADGAGSQLDILVRTFSPNGPGQISGPNFITDLRQTLTDPVVDPAAVDLSVPGQTDQTTLYFSAHMFTEPLNPVGSTLRLQVEVQEASAAFTGLPTVQSLTTLPGAVAVVPYTGLSNRNYKWQARTIDQFGRFSPYIAFATAGGVSFQINSASPLVGPVNNAPIVVNSKGKGNCGLLGLDAVALLGALRLIRRKRGAKK